MKKAVMTIEQISLHACNIGIYLRLSKDDGRIGESNSIRNQRDYLVQYLNEHQGILLKTYIDDGYSGTNFHRPDFLRMIRDIENKIINTVIVKDISRLGRDYITVGQYIEKFFPEHKVRFISLNDSYDSASTASAYSDIIPFKAVLFDLAAKDTSNKIRSSLETKMKKGEFIGSFAPYGYKKSPENKNKLEIDPHTAPVIQKIFSLYTRGESLTAIADFLNNENVLSPASYKSIHSNYMNPNCKKGRWTAQTIKMILSNSVYTGTLTQGKTRKISYKIKKSVKMEKKNQIIHKHSHPPIIDEIQFQYVQNKLTKKAVPSSQKAPHLLSGLLYCRHCGNKLTFRKDSRNKKFHTICTGYIKKDCTLRNSVYEELLNDRVLNTMKDFLQSVDFGKLSESMIFENKPLYPHKQNKGTAEIDKLIKSIYEDYKLKILDENTFKTLLSEYRQEKNTLLATTATNHGAIPQLCASELYKFTLQHLNEFIPQFINHIYIGNRTEVNICFAFRNIDPTPALVLESEQKER